MHEEWETTILGHIKISGRSLVVEVNSEKRAARFATKSNGVWEFW